MFLVKRMPKKKIISLCLFGLMALTSYASWQVLNNFLFSGQPSGNEVLLIAIAFLFLSVFFGLAVLLFDYGVAMAGMAATAGIFLLIFGIKAVYLLAVALGLIFLFLAVHQSLGAKKLHLRILSWEILKPSLAFFFTVVVLLISLVIYFSPQAQDLSVEIKLSRPLFNFIFEPVSGFFASRVSAPALGRDNYNEDLAAGLAEQIGKAETKDKIYEMVNQQLNYFLRSYKRFLPYGLAVAIFFALKTVSLVVVWLALGLVQLIFALMKSTGLVSIKQETAEKEVIEISNS